MKPIKTPVADLKLGDVVSLWSKEMGPYGDATVRCINKDGSAILFRPHVVCGNFSYTGGVLVSIGIEDVTVHSGFFDVIKNGDPLL